jgi:hypothetical protein
MADSFFDLFKMGVGPSCSHHTVRSMVAGNRFIKLLTNSAVLAQKFNIFNIFNIQVNLYDSLALAGKSHATDIACTLGLMSQTPDLVYPDKIPALLKKKMISPFVDQNNTSNWPRYDEYIKKSRKVV